MADDHCTVVATVAAEGTRLPLTEQSVACRKGLFVEPVFGLSRLTVVQHRG